MSQVALHGSIEKDQGKYEPAEPVPGKPKQIKSSHDLLTQNVENNGTYICEIKDGNETRHGEVELLILAPPKVDIDAGVGISTTQIYLNWTVYAYNSKIMGYDLKIRNDDKSGFVIHGEPPKNTSYVISGLKKSTNYTVRVDVRTDHASSNNLNTKTRTIATLDFDPVFVPNISINGFSATSVTIGWKKPDAKVAPYIHYYILEAKKKDENVSRRAYHSRDDNNLPYMFDNLQPHSTYIFKVRALFLRYSHLSTAFGTLELLKRTCHLFPLLGTSGNSPFFLLARDLLRISRGHQSMKNTYFLFDHVNGKMVTVNGCESLS